jgi:hypothetical protein
MNMKTICTCILAATMLLARPVLGQTDATALEAALHGKHLGLLSYSADSVVRFTYVDGKLLQDPILLHGLGVFTTDTVRQKGSKVLIEGQFGSLVLAGGSIHLTESLPMRIEVDLQGANAATVIPQLQAQLFFPSLGAALKGLPEYVSDLLPFPVDAKLQPACHCVRVSQDGKWIKLEENDPKLKPPAFSKMATNPALNQMAIDAKISGTLTLIYYVSETGRVTDVWLAKPLGGGLNESAAKTGRDNVFQPATLDGKSVGSVLIQTIPVN